MSDILRQKKKAFSIIEVLITMLIFTVGLVAVANLMLKSLNSSVNNRNLMIGSQLSQEGVELVRNFRDNNIVGGGNAFTNLPTGTTLCPRIGGVKGPTPDWVSCEGGGNTKLYFKTGAGTYVYDSGGNVAAPFWRKVTIGVVDADGNHEVVGMTIWGGTDFPAQNACNATNKCAYFVLKLNEKGWN